MKLQRELLPNPGTANESLTENRHTHPSYSFATYCEDRASALRGRYIKENFEEPTKAFGPHNGCQGECAGTGWIPVSQHDMKDPLRSLWVDAELDAPSEDGWHLLPCPACTGPNESLDEHIVKRGLRFEMRSKKTKSIVSSYGKPLKEAVLPGDTKDKTSQEHDDAKHAADNSRESSVDKKKKSKEKRAAKEKERKDKKLLPYEFINQKDAERAGGHLGIHGSHTTGNGIYKPGSSDTTLRGAVAQKKAKQKMRGRVREAAEEIPHQDLDKIGLSEMVQTIKSVTK